MHRNREGFSFSDICTGNCMHIHADGLVVVHTGTLYVSVTDPSCLVVSVGINIHTRRGCSVHTVCRLDSAP